MMRDSQSQNELQAETLGTTANFLMLEDETDEEMESLDKARKLLG